MLQLLAILLLKPRHFPASQLATTQHRSARKKNSTVTLQSAGGSRSTLFTIAQMYHFIHAKSRQGQMQTMIIHAFRAKMKRSRDDNNISIVYSTHFPARKENRTPSCTAIANEMHSFSLRMNFQTDVITFSQHSITLALGVVTDHLFPHYFLQITSMYSLHKKNVREGKLLFDHLLVVRIIM